MTESKNLKHQANRTAGIMFESEIDLF